MSEHVLDRIRSSPVFYMSFSKVFDYANKPFIHSAHWSQTIDKRHAVTNHDIDVEPALQGTDKGLEINFEDGSFLNFDPDM